LGLQSLRILIALIRTAGYYDQCAVLFYSLLFCFVSVLKKRLSIVAPTLARQRRTLAKFLDGFRYNVAVPKKK